MALLWLKPLAARTIAKTERLELEEIERERVRANAEEEKGRELAHV